MTTNHQLDNRTSRQRRAVDCICLMTLTVALAGCGSDLASVSGTVTLDGATLHGGRVVFQSSGGAMAVGNIESGGQYELNTGDTAGIAPGSYIVTVAAYEIGEPSAPDNPPPATLVSPRKYVDAATTDLRAEVHPGGNTIDFDLDSTP